MSGFRRRATTIKCKELWQPSLLSITFPIGDTELYFYLTTRVVQSWEQGQRNTPDCILYMIQRILELESEK